MKDSIVSSGTPYYRETLPYHLFSTVGGGDPLTALRVFDGPVNGSGMAVAVDFTACLAVGNFWLWDTNCTSADNGTTIIKPTRQDSSIAGRWVRLLGTAGGGSGIVLQVAGSPEGVVTAGLGALCMDTASPGTLYIKTTASGNTGWVVNP